MKGGEYSLRDARAYTTTNMRQGPGARMAALGGTGETCSVAEPSDLAVKVELLEKP